MPLKPVIAGFVNVPDPGTVVPSQTGHAGEFLTTDGTTPEWAPLSGGGDVVASGTLTNNNVLAGAGGTTVKDGGIATSAIASAITQAGTALQTVAVDGVTITGDGTVGDPLVAVAGGGDVTASGTLTNDAIALGGGTTVVKTTTTGTGIVAALGVNVGSAGAPVLFNGAGGTPSSMTGTNITGTAAGLTAGAASAVAASGITAGTLAANITLGEGAGQIVLDASLSADGTYSGILQSGTAGATLAFGDLCYFAAADSRWELADASAAATAGSVQLGICVLAAAADGDPTMMLLSGKVRADTAFPSFTVGAPVYISETAGDVTETQPTTTDAVIRVCGFAQTADSIWFNPSGDYITHV